MSGPSPPATSGSAGADTECAELFKGEAAALAKGCKVRWGWWEDRLKRCQVTLVEDDKLNTESFSQISSLGSEIPIKSQNLISREYVAKGWSTFFTSRFDETQFLITVVQRILKF